MLCSHRGTSQVQKTPQMLKFGSSHSQTEGTYLTYLPERHYEYSIFRDLAKVIVPGNLLNLLPYFPWTNRSIVLFIKLQNRWIIAIFNGECRTNKKIQGPQAVKGSHVIYTCHGCVSNVTSSQP